MKVWGDKFGRAKDNEETKFYKNFKILKDKGVIFPNEYRYIDDTKIKRTGKRQDQSK